jgi:hypothetical protein
VALEGSAGIRAVPAMAVARALGLRSTKWAVQVQLGDAPPPPPAADHIQELPDEAARATSAARPVRTDAVAGARPRGHHHGPPAWTLPAVLAALAAAAAGVRTVGRARRRPDEA